MRYMTQKWFRRHFVLVAINLLLVAVGVDAEAAVDSWTPDPSETIPIPSNPAAFDTIRNETSVLVLLDGKCNHVAALAARIGNGVVDLLPDFETLKEFNADFVEHIDKALASECNKAQAMKPFKPRGDQTNQGSKDDCATGTAKTFDLAVTTVCRFDCQDIDSVEWVVPLKLVSGTDYQPLMFVKGEGARAELRRRFQANALLIDYKSSGSFKNNACGYKCPNGGVSAPVVIAGRTYCVCR